MTLRRALAYFFGEAAVSLARSWKVSILAVLTIAVSLFMGGLFLLVSDNMSAMVQSWREQIKVILYLKRGVSVEEREDIRRVAAQAAWVSAIDTVSAQEAEDRFRQTFPSLGDLLEGWERDPLPESLEISLDPRRQDPSDFDTWIERLRKQPGVVMVDDDRDWLGRVDAAVVILRGLGWTLGTFLLGAAMFTTASVIRLTAYLYRDEIAVMRLVGATEFYIRGPFYVEGFLQGLLGGLFALAGLAAAYLLLRPERPELLLGNVLMADFLPALGQVLLVVIGGVAGLVGAVVSLRDRKLRFDD